MKRWSIAMGGRKAPRSVHHRAQLPLSARFRFEVDVVDDRGVVVYSFMTVGNRTERRYAQLRAALIARTSGGRIFLRRKPL